MRIAPLTKRLPVVAGLLLAALLPLAVVQPFLPVTSSEGEADPSAWLRAQVQGDTPAAFDEALAAAEQRRGAHTLRGFLAAFQEEYARRTAAEEVSTQGRSRAALVRDVRKELARNGMLLGDPVSIGAPPATPTRAARGVVRALLPGPPTDRFMAGGPPESGWAPARSQRLSAAVPFVASVARGPLLRVLSSAQALGP